MLEIPMLKGLGGLGFNLNMKLKNSDIENFLQNKMVTYLKEALESTMETQEEYANQFGQKNQFEACMKLDFSNGFNNAFGITEEAFGELMRD